MTFHGSPPRRAAAASPAPSASALRALMLALAAAAIVLPAAAQDDARRLAQAREALRRAQQSLQSTQSERDTLQQDKTKLEQQKQQADQALAGAAAKQKDTEAARARLSSSVASLTSERERLQAELEQARATGGALQKALDDTRTRLADAERRGADQRGTTLALRTMLERSVRSLSDNERQNQVLYDLGTRAVADYRECQEHGSSSPDGNLLGLGTVRTTSVAEELRREMDAVAGPATLARPAPPASAPGS